MTEQTFPPGFLWAAGTNGVQNEGATLVDGGGPSVWHAWSRIPGNVTTKETPDDGPDFYHRYRDDLRLMRDLGLTAHNFGVSWARVMPDGTGSVNQAGLDFYDRLVDETLACGMAPICGMYTWDHPQALEDRGGWLERDSADWFARYAEVLYGRLGDRVTHWLPMCEIVSFSHYAYFLGYYPPMLADPRRGLTAVHHQLLAQGKAVQAFRASVATGQIGNWHLHIPVSPKSDSDLDVAAAERLDAFNNGLVLEPQLLGRYPRTLLDWYGATWPEEAIQLGDLATIATPIDFLGIDYYGSSRAGHGKRHGELRLNVAEAFDENDPDGLRRVLTDLRERFADLPALVVEIGITVKDRVIDGRVEDDQRIEYLRTHLDALRQAITEGADVLGLSVWGLLDGWEFYEGLTPRYGLVHVDHATGRRTPKSSAHWYGRVARSNCVSVST